ncbi:hypothetical protein CJ195_12465 [Bacillus sp. UMB0899]|nr:hypothetical protein CJ195_12465 [Bacillus sp. UMB0899]
MRPFCLQIDIALEGGGQKNRESCKNNLRSCKNKLEVAKIPAKLQKNDSDLQNLVLWIALKGQTKKPA